MKAAAMLYQPHLDVRDITGLTGMTRPEIRELRHAAALLGTTRTLLCGLWTPEEVGLVLELPAWRVNAAEWVLRHRVLRRLADNAADPAWCRYVAGRRARGLSLTPRH